MTVPPATLGAIHARFAKGDATGAWADLAPLVVDSRDGKALQLAGMIRRAMGDLSDARDWLERSAAAGGGGEALNMLGNVLADLGEPDAADDAFERAARAAPADPNPWINRGRLASRRERHPTAIAHLRRAVDLAPRSVIASVALGNALRAGGDADAAVTELTRARDLEPQRAATGVPLGVALTAADRPADAIAAFDAAERAGDRSPELAHNRAAARLALGALTEAQADYDRLVTAFPAYLPGHQDRARLIHEYGLAGDPFASFAALARQYPREATVWEAWCQAQLAFRRPADAARVAAEGMAAAGPTPTLRLARAMGQAESGAEDEAARGFDAMAAEGIILPGQMVAHARLRLKRRDPERAAAIAEEALAGDPDNQLAWAYLGTAWRLLGDPREMWLHDYERHVGVIAARPPGVDDAVAFAADAAETLRALHVTRVHPADQSLRNGTQTPGALFDRREPAIRAIVAAVRDAVARFVASLPDDPTHPFLRRTSAAIRFAGSWSVRLTREGFHINHVHERGWISSAFYFTLPERSGDEGALALGVPPVELDLDLAPRRIVQPEVGRLILFPSSMWHGTVPFAREGERLTVAFDVVPD